MTDLENQIISLRLEGYSYGAIQLKLGNPSKKKIKDTLALYHPELKGDIIPNNKRLRSTY